MNVIVCGGCDFRNRHVLFKALDQIEADEGAPFKVYEGGARGADYLALRWAEKRGRLQKTIGIDNRLDGYDSDAPKCRNIRMFYEALPALVIGFPGGAGTNHMLSLAHGSGARVMDVEVDGDTFEVHEWPVKK